MFFDLFRLSQETHLKRAEILLCEAQIARIEHQAAAEHHGALARMYTERVRRLEIETSNPSLRSSSELPTKIQEERQAVFSLGEKRLAGLPTVN